MLFNLKTGLFPYLEQLIIRNANIRIHHTMAFPVREMMMVRIPTGPVGMASIRKFDPVQQSHVNQHLDCPENAGVAQAGIHLLQNMPEILHAEILAADSQFGQAAGYIPSTYIIG